MGLKELKQELRVAEAEWEATFNTKVQKEWLDARKKVYKAEEKIAEFKTKGKKV